MVSMTTQFASDYEMDFSHLDDKMEMGTSPYPTQIDDLDFEFIPDRQQSIDRSMADEEAIGNNTDPMQADTEELYNDDDMLDDETLQQTFDEDLVDLSMETYEGENMQDRDEVILYDVEDTGSYETVVEDVFQPQAQNETATLDHNVADEVVKATVEGQITHTDTSADHNDTNFDIDTDEAQLYPEVQNTAEVNIQEITVEPRIETVSSVDVLDFAAETAKAQEQEELVHEDAGFHSEQQESVVPEIPEHSNEEFKTDHTHSEQVPAGQDSLYEEQAVPEEVAINMTEPDKRNSSDSADQLHPVTVLYLGQEMSLFPPMVDDSSATFFLSDPSLAYDPVEKLLSSCREILGETLEHDDELVLDIPTLGLHLCEDSKYVSQVTLSQIVDVYLNLSRNENMENIEPLYCSLTSRVCLSSQYAYLAACAIEGKTYSEIAADYIGSPDHESTSFHEDAQQIQNSAVEPVGADSVLATGNEIAVETQTAQQDTESSIDGEAQAFVDVTDDINPAETTEQHLVDATTLQQDEDNANEEAIPNVEELQPQDQAEQLTRLPPAEVEKKQSASPQHIDEENEPVGEVDGTIDVEEDLFQNEEAEDDSASLSSHTIEGDDNVESTGRSQTDVQKVDDSLKTSDQLDGQNSTLDADEYDIDESLFNEDDHLDNQTQDDDKSIPALLTENGASNRASNGAAEITAQGFEDDGAEHHFDDDEHANEFDVSGVDQDFDTLPVTPSKQSTIKRKALDDEDDLDFLDFSTPEPKRTRSS